MTQKYLKISDTWHPLPNLRGDSSKPFRIFDIMKNAPIDSPNVGQWLLFSLQGFIPNAERGELLTVEESATYTKLKDKLSAGILGKRDWVHLEFADLLLMNQLIRWIYPLQVWHEEAPRVLQLLAECPDQIPTIEAVA